MILTRELGMPALDFIPKLAKVSKKADLYFL